MQVEIIQGGQVLRSYTHEGQQFVEAPPTGEYQIRITNRGGRRRLAVISVDGINVIDASNAGFDGPGYVLTGWQAVTIPGWRRSDATVANFAFNPNEGESYAEQTGRGKKNTGVIGIAVFDEKYVPRTNILRSHCSMNLDGGGGGRMNLDGGGGGGRMDVHDTFTYNTIDEGSEGESIMDSCSFDDVGGLDRERGCETLSSNAVAMPTSRKSQGRLKKESRKRRVKQVKTSGRVVPELATGYGQEATFHTSTTEFERATQSPAMIVTVRYAVRDKLIEWGVPVSRVPDSPSAFPASETPSCPAPGGWRG